MKIKVKHLETEIEVSDNDNEDGRSLIYHNQNYCKELIEKIVEQIKKLQNETDRN